MTLGSRGVYEALKKLFVTDKDGHIAVDDLTKWGGTALTGRDITGDLANLNVGLDTRARLQPWYQTNFDSIEAVYGAGSVAPHASTVRWSYTVPTARIAIITHAFNEIMRDVAPSTAARAASIIDTLTNTYISDVREITSTVGNSRQSSVGWCTVLKAAEGIQGRTIDGSTGGSYQYWQGMTAMEFNT